MYDTIIIGAGMSGLAAGIRLAYFDKRVCILERHYTIGGLNSFYRLRGRDYDVGLHAVTNYATRESKTRGPLSKLLRQLRLKWEDFSLSPQIGSSVRFPDVELKFTNDIDLLRAEIRRGFPGEVDNFERLLDQLIGYEDLENPLYSSSTREILSETFDDPLLIEMILCPTMWYGNGCEHDMDFGSFSIMFRSIFMEGFGRPYKGVRLILKNLIKKFRSLGGELRLRSGVDRICVDDERAVGVVLDNGEEVQGRQVLSSAGLVETMRLCDDITDVDERLAGRISFTESVSILDRQPRDFGHDQTIIFFNNHNKFDWSRPKDKLCDTRTGVFCSPNNFDYDASDGELPDGVVRISTLADFDGWTNLEEEQYRLEKLKWYDEIVETAVELVPDFRRFVIDTDFFTPKTIRRFTWHDNGAVYGAPKKNFDGTTHLKNMFLCGTDQGFVGIVGSIISGIQVANRYMLRE